MDKRQYLAAVNAAKNGTTSWENSVGTHRLLIGDLVLEAVFSPNVTTWTLELASGELLTSGNCQTLELAKQEALSYADHYVRTVLHTEMV